MELEWNLPVRQGWLSVVGMKWSEAEVCEASMNSLEIQPHKSKFTPARKETQKQQNVRGGPNYKVQLLADFVLPDLVLSHELLGVTTVLTGKLTPVIMEPLATPRSIDFGRIVVGVVA